MRFQLTRKFKASEIAALTGGELIGKDITVAHLSSDTRELAAGDAFLALRGEHFDGNAYLGEAQARGAALVICEEEPPRDMSAVRVPSCENALLAWAGAVRREVAPTVIAVTGSVGKTTAKNAIAAVLSRVYKTYKTKGNLNNLLGVPFTLLSMPQDTEFLVAEAGMNRAGELARLSALLEPDTAVITNVGQAHIGNLGSRAGIARAKREILLCAAAGAYYLYPADEPLLSPPCRGGLVPMTVGERGADCLFSYRGGDSADIRFGGKEYRRVTLNSAGRHHAYAAALALAVGALYGVSNADIRAGLVQSEQDGLRGEQRELCGARILLDCYNASPEAMRAACDLLMQTEGKRKLALLGDMLELGEHTRRLHEEIGGYFAAAGLDMLFTFGAAALCYAGGARRAGMLDTQINSNADPADPAVSAAQIEAVLREGDVLLIKASRALAAERIFDILQKNLLKKKGE